MPPVASTVHVWYQAAQPSTSQLADAEHVGGYLGMSVNQS